ncbi:MAG: hypothetical protein ACTHMU_16645, partial [Thermomicrobiales bacterium]
VVPGSDEAAIVHALVERHYNLTGSPRAAAILAGWERYVAQFWFVQGKPPVELAPNATGRPERPRREPGATNRPHAPITVRRPEKTAVLAPTGTETH